MRICFFAGHNYYGGLANNGGSRTILKSCEELERQGHETCIVTNSDRFMFFDHKSPVRKIPKNWDAYIAVSILDLHEMIKHVPASKSAVWIRGWETWRKPGSKLLHIVRKCSSFGTKVFVNSIALRGFYGGQILYPGYDPIWYQEHRAYDKPRIGVLHHIKRTKGYWFFKEVKKILGGHYGYVEAGKRIVGDNGMADVYHKVDIWLAPTCSEGLHCPPMEAGLCGALVVCSDHPHNGMVPDYASQETAMVYHHGDVEGAVTCIRNADYSKVPKMIQKIRKDIGTRERNMKRLISLLED